MLQSDSRGSKSAVCHTPPILAASNVHDSFLEQGHCHLPGTWARTSTCCCSTIPAIQVSAPARGPAPLSPCLATQQAMNPHPSPIHLSDPTANTTTTAYVDAVKSSQLHRFFMVRHENPFMPPRRLMAALLIHHEVRLLSPPVSQSRALLVVGQGVPEFYVRARR
uniref:Uncharacterized protein n=1 Tax=Compsopogon caeruleus TaxID=31354 RepID=A0A7S1TI79_9RHOD